MPLGAAEMGEAKYGVVEVFNTPWAGSAYGVGVNPREQRPGIWTHNKKMAEDVADAFNALSGIANVEALGALLKASEDLWGCQLVGSTHPTRADYEAWCAAYDALYAPQASEAKP